MDVYSFVIYSFFFITATTLALLADKSKKTILIIFTYVFIVSFWSIRFEIGYDYYGYVSIYDDIRIGMRGMYEKCFEWLCIAFSNTRNGHIYVLSWMSAITFFFLLKAFWNNGIFAYGIIFSIAFQFQFMAANQVRQALAIAAFIYVIKWLENKQYLKYAISIILISFLFHTSAIFLLLSILVPLCKFRLSPKIWSIIIIMLFVLNLAGYFDNLGTTLMTTLWIPEQYQHFLLSINRMQAENIGFSVVALFNVLVALYIAYHNTHIREQNIYTLYMIGVCIYIAFIEFHLIQRLSYYLLYLNMYICAILVKKDYKKHMTFTTIIILFFLLLCTRENDLHGVIPYKNLLNRI